MVYLDYFKYNIVYLPDRGIITEWCNTRALIFYFKKRHQLLWFGVYGAYYYTFYCDTCDLFFNFFTHTLQKTNSVILECIP